MTKKAFTIWFTIISTILNILFTALIIGILAVSATLILTKVIGTKNGQIFIVVWMMCFLAGLVLGMFLFGRISSAIITKYNLASKLDPKIIGKHLPNGNVNKYAQKEEEEKKVKTVMPDSVKEDDDPWENQ